MLRVGKGKGIRNCESPLVCIFLAIIFPDIFHLYFPSLIFLSPHIIVLPFHVLYLTLLPHPCPPHIQQIFVCAVIV